MSDHSFAVTTSFNAPLIVVGLILKMHKHILVLHCKIFVDVWYMCL